jgi:hypothetical protein
MMEISGKVEQLKTLLAKAKNFDEPWRYFAEELARHREFMALGTPSTNVLLDTVVATTCAEVVGRHVRIHDPLTLHMPKHGMWHGTVRVGACSAFWFYFEQSDQGLVGVMRSLADQRIELVRFSLLALPPTAGFVPTGYGQA